MLSSRGRKFNFLTKYLLELTKIDRKTIEKKLIAVYTCDKILDLSH